MIPSGLNTLLARGIVKTGVTRKFSFKQFLRYGNELSAAETEYVLSSSCRGGRFESISATHFAVRPG
jgi:hypothetical protein